MKSGKVSDTVLRRSVLAEVQKVNQGTSAPLVGGGAGALPLYHASGGIARAGQDGRREAVDIPVQERETGTSRVFSAMQTVCGEGAATAYLAAVRAANSLAAKAVRPQYASAALTVPETMDERELRRMYARCCDYLQRKQIKITGGIRQSARRYRSRWWRFICQELCRREQQAARTGRRTIPGLMW